MSKRFIVVVVAVCLAGAFAATVQATPGSGVVSTPLGKGRIEDIAAQVKTGDWKIDIDSKGVSDVAVTEHRLDPGDYFGWHSHPGPSIVVVRSGTLSFYRGDDETCTAIPRPAGTAFVDPGGTVHTARNEGTSEVVVLVTALMPTGAIGRIDEPNPGHCPF